MKKMLLVAAMLVATICASAQQQDTSAFGFVTVKANAITPVKNQASSGTCWCFSGLGLIEAELLRMGKGEVDFSEMYIVRRNYADQARKYVRMHGHNALSAGGSFADVIDGMREYGLVPESEMPGLNYGEELHRHGEMDAVIKAYADAILRNPNRKLTPVWDDGLEGILDAYLGKSPETFTVAGKQYTPQSYMASLGINPDDYISITSFTHHPFYTAFPIEVPDNWRWALSYNLPMEEMMQVIDAALEGGYSVAWASDVSERGFSRQGVAVVPDLEAEQAPGSDQARWLGLSSAEREKMVATQPVPEKQITQAMRQSEFDNYLTTDDHGMLIYGSAKDKNGAPYFLVKNSWGTASPYQGIWYASRPFVELKTISIVVNKKALPAAIAGKLDF